MPRSDGTTKKGHLMLLADASQNLWERRYFVLRRPFLHMYTHSNEQDEIGIVSLTGVNVESDRQKEQLLGVSHSFSTFFSLGAYDKRSETLLILSLHLLKFIRACRSQSQRAAILGHET